MSNLLKALSYGDAGWCVIPLIPLTLEHTCACRNPTCPGKHPIHKDWYNKASSTESSIRRFWGERPDAGIGIVTGTKSRLAVLDIDPRNDGPTTLEGLTSKYGELPETYEVRTGGGGTHYYFEYPNIDVYTCVLGKGIDFKAESKVKGSGHFVVAPPTHHKSGFQYEVVRAVKPAPLPIWLLLAVTNIQQEHANRSILLPEKIEAGTTHETFKQLIGRLKYGGLSEVDALNVARSTNLHNTERSLPNEELEALVKNVYTNTRNGYTLDDVGNAQRFSNLHHKQFRFCKDSGLWYKWSGKHWAICQEVELGAKLVETVEMIRNDAAACGDPELRDKILGWAHQSRFGPRLTELQKLVAREEKLWVAQNQLDAHPEQLNCLNGTVNLRTGELTPHKRENYHSQLVEVNYDPSTTSDLWLRFLSEAGSRDQHSVDFLQLCAGYSLTGLTDEEVMFFIHGPGGTGKTTFVESIRGLLGSYAQVVKPQLFLDGMDNQNGPSPEVAKLAGCRLLVSSEIPRNAKLGSWATKALTGGDTISARHLYKKAFQFRPTFKAWLTMNDLPTFHHEDTGIKRRIIPIPFTHVPKVPDPYLKRTFLTDPTTQSAILTWCIRGAVRWFSGEKLQTVPRAVTLARQEYEASQNPLYEWSTLYKKVPFGRRRPNKTTHLWLHFKTWCDNIKTSPSRLGLLGERDFNKALKGLGYSKDTSGHWDLELAPQEN